MADSPIHRPLGLDQESQGKAIYPYSPPKEVPAGKASRNGESGRSAARTLWHVHKRARRSAWGALRYRDFRLYFAGSLLSNLGTWLQNTAQVLLVYQLTHSVFAVGIVTCAQFSSFLLLSHFAAVLASRIGSKRLLIITQLFSAAIAGSLAFVEAAGKLTERPLILGALLLGLSFTFTLPVQMALVPKLVYDTDTEAAMAMNSVSYNAGRAIAPALAVVVILTIGFTWVFVLNAISFVVFAITLAVAHPAGTSRPVRRARARDGLGIALAHPQIALLLVMVAAVTFADDPILTLGPTLAHRVLGVSHEWAGYFLSALGLGTILGTFRPSAPWKTALDGKRVSAAKRAAGPLFLLAGAIVVFAVGISVWMSLLAAFTAGVAALWIGAVTQTCLVRHKPAQDASIMALWAIAWAGTKPLASLADGWLAGHLGVLPAAILLTTPALLAAALALGLRGSPEQAIRDRFTSMGARLQKRLCLSVPDTD
jgi:MFS family permease